MNKVRLDDTIAAVSTPVGEGGIGIVRLSGRDALKVADRIFLSKDGKMPSSFRTYTVHYGHIAEKSTKRLIDEVILTVMRSPGSYTKEDVVEINCHSGIASLRSILDLVLKNGAMLAEPGEFTKRAFLNGRIDISQAESVLDIIKAKTDLSLKAALNNLGGLLSKKIEYIRNELMGVFTRIEASIDFAEEEDIDALSPKDILNRLKRAKKETETLIATARKGKVLRQGVKTVICGSPNVGKSSLMNALLRESRSIVTRIPGTTTDTIEETINIKGMPVVLVDTAGISRSRHPVAKQGIERSHFSIKEADLILFVTDHGRKIEKRDLDIIAKIKDKEIILVINKKDLAKRINVNAIKRKLPKKPIAYVSALNGSGIGDLEKAIQNIIFKGKVTAADMISVSNDRQLEILNRSLEAIKKAISGCEDSLPADCIGVDVRSSIEALGEITGQTITEEALDRIFSEFCVGK